MEEGDSKKGKKKKEKKRSGDDDDGMSGYSAAENALETRQNFLFHLCMTFASIYISMLYTNWATDTASDNTARGRGNASLGVNIAAQYLAFGLYTWLLVAPMICPDRFKDEDE